MKLIKCREIFKFNPKLENRVKNLDDKTLQNLIDYDWVNYHLEYLELARIEYLKRGFKSDAKNGQASEPIQIKYLVKSYSILRSVIGVLKGLAIAGVIIALVFAFGMGTAISILIIIQGILFAIGIFVFA
jgi:hypothetical protein